ncbi:MAG TPA: DEAD/DEAH box helicase [Bacteroidales bacterium]|nr:DEAD/DEAH box helicase [Bacteroidales bacterium]HPS51377.1 DEAD/DEAH box helicase [Bacteroidales bacterium]
MTFHDFGFEARLIEGIEALGYKQATPIQEQAIPVILKEQDLIGAAQTGTGKTAAFLLPVIQQVLSIPHDNRIKALVIVPTRELAMQIDQQMEGLSYFTPVSSIPVYGGTDGASFSREKQALMNGADMVICTPGRMIAHLNMGYVNFGSLRYLILDEADRMLDMGFHEDIMKIISHIPADRQTLMFAATMPVEIRELARKILRDPVEINIAVSKPADNILQLAYSVYETQKIALAEYFLKDLKGRSVLIFCSTKSATKQLTSALKRLRLNAEEIHSDLDQPAREAVLMKFRNKALDILVATDIVSRGIDIDDIDLVLNYDVPNEGEDYIHRIGRTARASSRGAAITLISEKDQRKFAVIEQLLGKPVHKGTLPLFLGTGPVFNPKNKTGKSYRGKKKQGK